MVVTRRHGVRIERYTGRRAITLGSTVATVSYSSQRNCGDAESLKHESARRVEDPFVHAYVRITRYLSRKKQPYIKRTEKIQEKTRKLQKTNGRK